MGIKRFSNSTKVNNAAVGNALATGGVITSSGGYTYHTFTIEDGNESTTFNPTKSTSVEVLVIAGGGGGGGQVGGGGGAGGAVYNSSYSVTANTPVSITVGRGGTSTGIGLGGRINIDNSSTSLTPFQRIFTSQAGSDGFNSVFGNITSLGGGGGGGYSGTYLNAASGGCGGGGGGSSIPGASSTQGSSGGGTGYGYAGGNGLASTWAGGGGGGIGAAGSNGSSANSGTGGAGGVGRQYFGNWYGAGGSGCSNSSAAGRVSRTNNIGGFGGWTQGGSVGTIAINMRAGDGVPGTGSGGGGARDNDRLGYFNGDTRDYASFGGSGIVIVRYAS